MVINNNLPLRHIHKRKRTTKKLKPFPTENKTAKIFDRIIYPAAMISPIMTIPQIMKIWVEQNAAGVSLLSWSAYTISGIFWLMYGILHKEKPIIFANSMGIFLHIFILSGTVLYG